MARKSRKQTAAPMPAPSLYVHVALYIRLSVEDNKKRGCSVENQKLVDVYKRQQNCFVRKTGCKRKMMLTKNSSS